MSRDLILTAGIECLRSQRTVRGETIFISPRQPDDPSDLPKLIGWFKNYDFADIREGDELNLAFVDGRRCTVVVRSVADSAELSAPIILFVGDRSL